MRYRQSDETQSSVVGDRVVLYHRVSQQAIVLNPSGSRLWHELKVARSEAELADRLRLAYPGLSETQAVQDVAAYLQQLDQRALVIVEP